VSPVVRVQGVPFAPAQALSRTGTSSTVPLVELAGGSVIVGLGLVATARRRRLVAQQAPTIA